MREPLLPVSGFVGPEYGFPVLMNLRRLAFVVFPMSKQLSVQLKWPSFHHLTYLSAWSRGSNPRCSTRLSARQRAREVSSVQSPAFKLKGPPPRRLAIGAKLPLGSNSIGAPRASPTARPRMLPLNLLRRSIVEKGWLSGYKWGALDPELLHHWLEVGEVELFQSILGWDAAFVPAEGLVVGL